MKERQCERCEGTQFQLTSEAGAVFSWRDNSGNGNTWFCPNCDWGDQHKDE